MQIEISERDLICIYLKDKNTKVARTRSRPGDINVDLDDRGDVIGIELIAGSKTPMGNFLAVLKEFGLDQRLVVSAA